jgi:hypothetical protein
VLRCNAPSTASCCHAKQDGRWHVGTTVFSVPVARLCYPSSCVSLQRAEAGAIRGGGLGPDVGFATSPVSWLQPAQAATCWPDAAPAAAASDHTACTATACTCRGSPRHGVGAREGFSGRGCWLSRPRGQGRERRHSKGPGTSVPGHGTAERPRGATLISPFTPRLVGVPNL